MSTTQDNLNLNLQERAALRIAISLWQSKEVKEKITSLFKFCNKSSFRKTQNEWELLIKKVANQWHKNIIPQKLDYELIHIIKMIGETIFNWCQYIKFEMQARRESINCISKIHWTPHGTVDAVQTFKLYWLKNPNVSVIQLYNFACSHALEENINDLWHKMPKDIQDYSLHGIYDRSDRHILAYWQYRRNNNLSDLIQYFDDTLEFEVIYDLNRSINANMLRLSIHEGYFIAFQYFWEKLTEKEKSDNVLEGAYIAVMRYIFYKKLCVPRIEKIRYYKKSQLVEICVFLINQMTKSDKKKFFKNRLRLTDFVNGADAKTEVLEMLLSTWPWQKLYMSVLKDMLQYLDWDNTMDYTFLNTITDKMVKDHNLGYSTETSIYKNLFRKAWLIFPKFFKENMFKRYLEINFICNLINVWDVDSLRLVINDPEIAGMKSQLVIGGLELFKELVQKDQFEKLDKFIDEILGSKENHQWFKDSIDAWFGLVLIDRLDLADKLLDWRCNTPEERQAVKNKIDHETLCEELIHIHGYELANKFLNWKMETEDEKRNGKSCFKRDRYPISHIYTIWITNGKNIERAKKESTKFLEWLFESDEEITRFKKEASAKFATDELDTIFLVEFCRIGIVNEFLLWFSSSDEEIQRIKQGVIPRRNGF